MSENGTILLSADERMPKKTGLDPVLKKIIEKNGTVVGFIPWNYKPGSPEDMLMCLRDPWWRICSGQLYRIMVKSDDGDGTNVPFKPNKAQIKFMRRLWHRNIILKARQLGFTTLACIMWLDHAMFNSDQRCGIIAQDLPAAQAIFRDKVKFAYDNLPEALKAAMPLKQDSQTELLFAHNNSAFRVAVSMRSGTIHRLHISEFGKICAKFPQKAHEIVTGSFPAVPLDGITIVESTSEGMGGDFHEMSIKAQLRGHMRDTDGKPIPLTAREYRHHFYAWHDNDEYRMPPKGITITDKDHEYFDKVEIECATHIGLRARAWYIATRDSDFAGSPEKMWQEYPSTPKEAFQKSTEGTYYAKQYLQALKDGRIGNVPFVTNVPVDTFWDIGNTDGTAVWFHQRIGKEHRFINFIEGWGESYGYFIKEMQEMGYVWGTHWLPHDARHKRQQGHRVASPLDMLEELTPGWRWDVVPVVDEVIHGIQATRDVFGQCWFDETKCQKGLEHIQSYKKEWDQRLAVWKPTPRHDEHSEAADALRQFGQLHVDGEYNTRKSTKPKRRPSGMAV